MKHIWDVEELATHWSLSFKRGHRVIYDEEDLLVWAAQFRKITNTSQSSIDRAS